MMRPGWKNEDHYWFECPLCGPALVCGKCGNNACNSGYGTLEDGSDCDECQKVYELARIEWSKHSDEELRAMHGLPQEP